MDLSKLENADDIKVYKLHEVDLDNKVFQFTNDFPILMAGEPYAVVLDKGVVNFAATNVLIAATPKEPNAIYNADAIKQVGWWCGTFKRIYRDELLEKNAYIPQYDGKFKPAHKEDGNIFLGAFCPYFSALEPLGIEEFQVKYIHTENGEEIGDVTDFPADEFDIDFGIENEMGIETIGQSGKLQFDNSIYDLQGRRVSQPTKGLYIVNGKKVVIK
jgi:hypothetical protein